MIEGFSVKSTWIPCQTKIMADSKTGKRLIWDTARGEFIPDPKKKTPVNKKTLFTIYAETTTFVDDEKLVYSVYAAEKINRNGLNFNMEPVFRACIKQDGELVQYGEGSLDMWLNNIEGKLIKDLLVPDVPLELEKTCSKLFGVSAQEIFKTSEGSFEKLFELAETDELKQRLLELKDPIYQKWGLELEFTGITRKTAALTIAKVLKEKQNAEVNILHLASVYDKYEIKDANGRNWYIVRDASISAQIGKRRTEEDEYKCELVTPVCNYDDIKPLLQPMIRALRHEGARINKSCGIHVHVDSERQTAASVRHLSNLMAANEDLLYKALNVHEERLRYCRKTNLIYLSRLNRMKIRSMEDLARAWYGGTSRANSHYDNSRYVALNLHSMFSGKGIEFRCFNSTLHAGRVRAYIEFCLMFCGYAKTRKRSSKAANMHQDDVTAMKNLMKKIGLNGEQFSTARLHLLANLLKEKNMETAA